MNFDKLENTLNENGVVFLSYGGFLSQTLIAGMTEALEKEAENNEISMRVSNNIFTIFIELSQNMMNYSKAKHQTDKNFDPKGIIVVGFDDPSNSYYVMSRNIISHEDKEKIEPKIKQAEELSNEELKKLYRELRKSGRDKHHKGAGIGFIEIGKRCDKLEHQFVAINEKRYYFSVKAIIENTLKG